jgi:hypothetical protein
VVAAVLHLAAGMTGGFSLFCFTIFLSASQSFK